MKSGPGVHPSGAPQGLSAPASLSHSSPGLCISVGEGERMHIRKHIDDTLRNFAIINDKHYIENILMLLKETSQ